MSGIMTRANITEAFEFASLNTQYAGPVQMIAFHPENTWLACATYDQLFLWDIQRRRLRFQAQMNVQALAFQPDGAALVVASADILFLSLPEGEVQNSLKGHPQGTTCLDLARRDDDILLASGGMDGVVRIGNLNTRRLVHKLAHDAPVRQIAFSPDGTLLAALSWGTKAGPAARMSGTCRPACCKIHCQSAVRKTWLSARMAPGWRLMAKCLRLPTSGWCTTSMNSRSFSAPTAN
jgi:WD40 repeat protein